MQMKTILTLAAFAAAICLNSCASFSYLSSNVMVVDGVNYLDGEKIITLKGKDNKNQDYYGFMQTDQNYKVGDTIYLSGR